MWDDAMSRDELLSNFSIPDEAFYARPAVDVARALLGHIIVCGATAGRIVEVEAYLGVTDLAAHSAAGLTDRTRVIFGPPGRAYVYLIYGMYECLNFVAEPDGVPGCVLIRALEPLCGVSLMHERRVAARRREQLCSGPGKLTRAMGITRAMNGRNVTEPGDFVVREMAQQAFEIVTTKRIGITKCADWPLRFYIAGNPYVSR